MGKGPDWARTGTIVAYAEWLRDKSDAICVLVIRAHDASLAVDPRCKPEDAEQLVNEYVPRLAGQVEEARREKKKGARLELGPCLE